jgi:hypothetical protein
MNLEEYRKIKNYENYEISNFGNIRNSKTSIILKQKLKKNGYYEICLCKDNKKKSFIVHRLVAFAFIPNDDNSKPEIDHIDRNKINNHTTNLRWVNRSENLLNKDYYHHKKTVHHHIWITPNLTFCVGFMINKKRINKSFKMLEEAIIYRDNFMLNNKK